MIARLQDLDLDGPGKRPFLMQLFVRVSARVRHPVEMTWIRASRVLVLEIETLRPNLAVHRKHASHVSLIVVPCQKLYRSMKRLPVSVLTLANSVMPSL